MSSNEYRKIFFELSQDEHGYPPDRWESLWATELEERLYRIDSIPFFVKGISSEDIVSVESDGEVLTFARLIRPSTNSVVRLYVFDVDEVQAARESFRALGCESELSHLPKLFAIEIPGNVSFSPIADVLRYGSDRGRWEYEEGVIRHKDVRTEGRESSTG